MDEVVVEGALVYAERIRSGQVALDDFGRKLGRKITVKRMMRFLIPMLVGLALREIDDKWQSRS